MKSILRLISFAALAAMFVTAILVFKGTLSREAFMAWGLGGTVAWFGTVPFWMKRRLHQQD